MTSTKSTWRHFLNSGLITATMLAAALHAADPHATSPATATKGEGASKLTGNDPTKNAPADLAAAGDTSQFIKKAAEGNSAEVALAEVALRKSDSPEVKQFAEMMKTQHTEANHQLQPLAQTRGIAIDQPLDSRHQQKVEKLQKLGGNEFDQEYAKGMLRAHQKNIAFYERAVQQLQDPDVKRYAQTTLPKLQQHLQHAEQTARAVGVDQTTITSILHESPDAMGGTVDKSESKSGHKQVDKE